jgi:hypothetical protein
MNSAAGRLTIGPLGLRPAGKLVKGFALGIPGSGRRGVHRINFQMMLCPVTRTSTLDQLYLAVGHALDNLIREIGLEVAA